MTGGADQNGGIRIERRGGLVLVTLDRPGALNALTLGMCQALHRGLDAWEGDPEVAAVIVEGAGERAFCAGGDIRWVAEEVERHGVDVAARFFRTEYRLNARLFHFPKPYIALLDGIVMGGGVGISIHGRYRIATERTTFAMPETGIGFFPDVGGTWALPRLPGEAGMYLGLTGHRLTGADCLALGIAGAFVPSSLLPDLTQRLSAIEPGPRVEEQVATALGELNMPPRAAPIESLLDRINVCFRANSLDGILLNLEQETSQFGEETLAVLRKKSPTSLRVAFEQLRRGRRIGRFDDAMRLEYRLVHRFLEGHDFREGVRALIVDKDQRPAWRPARLEDVSEADVERFFDPLPGGDLELASGEAGA
ncbi:MAG TPA: enoyl-CoA hydratase/isomerase family protein [Geminicoccaceae bacterium]